jgi:histidyl-tRNA synthetase
MKNLCHPMHGFVDTFGKQARLENFLNYYLLNIFEKWGYIQLKFPIIEHLECYSNDIIGHSPWPEWNVKGSFFIDISDYTNNYEDESISKKGILTPEGTVSVSRWLAKTYSLKSFHPPTKISYHCHCFRNEPIDKLHSVKRRQFEQVGMEIIGSSHLYSDLETLHLIAYSLFKLGIPKESIRLRISDIRIFNHLSNLFEISESDRVILKECLDAVSENRAKNDFDTVEIHINSYYSTLDKYISKENDIVAWKILVETSSENSVIEKIGRFFPVDIIKEIEHRVKEIQKLGYKAILDLAVVRSHEYYTALTMEVDVVLKDRIFVEVAGGGRYDRLIGSFIDEPEKRIPAVGFAFGLQRLIDILSLNKETIDITAYINDKEKDIILPRSNNYSKDSFLAETLRKYNKRVDLFVGDCEDIISVKEYAKLYSAEVFNSEQQSNIDDLFSPPYHSLYLDTFNDKETNKEVTDIIKWLDINPEKEVRILDVPCGVGRHSISFAQQGFNNITSIDKSEKFIQIAKDRAKDANTNSINFKCMDIRWLNTKESYFDLTLILYNSFGYYTEKSDFVFLNTIGHSLKRYGTLILQVINRDWAISHYQQKNWRSNHEISLLEENSFDHLSSYSTSSYKYISKNNNELPFQELTSSFRLYSVHELVKMIKDCNFVDVEVFSSFSREKFNINDSKYIIIKAINNN